MPRTTLIIDATLLRELQIRAARDGRTVQDVANEALRRGLRELGRPAYRLRLKGWSGRLRPGVDLTDRDRLLDLLDRKRP